MFCESKFMNKYIVFEGFFNYSNVKLRTFDPKQDRSILLCGSCQILNLRLKVTAEIKIYSTIFFLSSVVHFGDMT